MAEQARQWRAAHATNHACVAENGKRLAHHRWNVDARARDCSAVAIHKQFAAAANASQERYRFWIVDLLFGAYVLLKKGGKIMRMAVAEEKETQTKLNQLDQLKKFTKVVADTADFESIKEFKPQDATTNPSLVYAATQKQQYAHLIEEVLADRKKSELSGHEQIEDICDHLLVQFGCDILEIVPGRVSTETDARLSYDVEGSINKARTLIKLYEERKIPRERVLIKIASTWEGLLAAEQLQKEGIRCNLTLMFSLPQAVRAAEAKVQLISPFVGRIYDWYKKENKRDYSGSEDPGVQSVSEIY